MLSSLRARIGDGIMTVGILLSGYAFVVLAIFIYKIWKAIPSNIARTTPGKASGFLFIPVFNVIWYFPALWGWSQDWNAYSACSEGRLRRTSEILSFLVAMFFAAQTSVGLVGVFLAPLLPLARVLGAPNIILVPIFILQVCNLLNGAPSAPDQGAFGSPAQGKVSFGRTSLVIGIFSILLYGAIFLGNPGNYLCFTLMLSGLVCGILAIVLAKKQRRAFREPLSMAGLIIGIIGVVLEGLSLLGVIIAFLFQ